MSLNIAVDASDLPDFDREPLPSEEEEHTKKMIAYYLWLLLVAGWKERKEDEL